MPDVVEYVKCKVLLFHTHHLISPRITSKHDHMRRELCEDEGKRNYIFWSLVLKCFHWVWLILQAQALSVLKNSLQKIIPKHKLCYPLKIQLLFHLAYFIRMFFTTSSLKALDDLILWTLLRLLGLVNEKKAPKNYLKHDSLRSQSSFYCNGFQIRIWKPNYSLLENS